MVGYVTFVISLVIIGYPRNCDCEFCPFNICDWLQWQNWSSCSRTCGGGTQGRTRAACCLPFRSYDQCLSDCGLTRGDSSEYQSCNKHCVNGGTYRDNVCYCRDAYYGPCCDLECPVITHCAQRSCTRVSNVMCMRCEGEVRPLSGQRAYVLSADSKECIQACSWRSDSRWCFPGTCDKEYAHNCQCSSGFGGSNCMRMVEFPTILYSEFILNKGKSDENSVPKDVNEWPVKNPSWTNVKKITTMGYKFYSTYVPGYKPSGKVPDKHAFIEEYQVGITKGTVTTNFFRGNVMRPAYSNQHQCGSVSSRTPEKNIFKCVSDLSVSSTIPSTLTTGDMLEVKFDTENGGFVQVEDMENGNRITDHFYQGNSNQSTIRLVFDFAVPYHCVEHGCTTQVMTVPEITFTAKPNISWGGWSDDVSGLDYFDTNVFEMKYIPDNDRLEYGPVVPQGTTTQNTHRLELPDKGLYSVELSAFDRAGNIKTGRRIILYDKVSLVEARLEPALLVASASPLTDYSWQWTLDLLNIEWTGRYFNKLHHDNHWLEKVVPRPNIESDYDDLGKSRGVDKIPNTQGIVRFETSYRVDQDGGRSIISPGEFTSIGLKQSQVLTPSLKDGDTLRFWIRAIDIREQFLEENVTVHIDTSPPILRDLSWTGKMNGSGIEWESYDEESGLEEVSWKVFANASGNEIIYSQQHISLKGEIKDRTVCHSNNATSTSVTSCYCAPGVGCYQRRFRVPADDSKRPLEQGVDYFVEVTVTNHAKLKTRLTERRLQWTSRPLPGLIHNGKREEPEVTCQSGLELHAHWDGFSDTESGILFYTFKFHSRCLLPTDFAYDNVDDDVTKVSTSTASWTAPGPGKYFITVVAFNRALQPSPPVCSDGVTVIAPGTQCEDEPLETESIGRQKPSKTVTPGVHETAQGHIPTVVMSSVAAIAIVICTVAVVLFMVWRKRIRSENTSRSGTENSIGNRQSSTTSPYDDIDIVSGNTESDVYISNTSSSVRAENVYDEVTDSEYDNLDETARDLDIQRYASLR